MRASHCFQWAWFQVVILLLAMISEGLSIGLVPKKSISSSGQFIIYCDDLTTRIRLSELVEESKKGVLTLLGEKSDHWKSPVVVNAIRKNAAMPGQSVSSVRLIEVDEGFKVEFDFCLDADPVEVREEPQIVRSILLEYSCRNQPSVKGGEVYLEPPAWLVEGAVQIFHWRDHENRSDVYKALIESDHAPKLEELLAQDASHLDSISLALYQACSVALVQLLVDLPGGRENLSSYLRDTRRDNFKIEDLKKHFSGIGEGGRSLEKWWTLSLARLSASERYKGLSMEETDLRLQELLTLQLPGKKKGETQKFSLEQFGEFLKIKESKSGLTQMSARLLALQVISSPPIRPVIASYQGICDELAKGKTRGLAEQIALADKNRRMILHRMNDIADYMNWFEATQSTVWSRSFDSYLKAAAELSVKQPRRQDAISRYLDNIEIEFQSP